MKYLCQVWFDGAILDAMLSLITLPQVGLMAQRELTHTVALLFATSLFLFGFFRTLRQPTITSFLVIGIATGIGLISKYNFAILPASALIAVLPDREWRSRLIDWRLLPAIVVAILIVLPHAGTVFVGTGNGGHCVAGDRLAVASLLFRPPG